MFTLIAFAVTVGAFALYHFKVAPWLFSLGYKKKEDK